MKTPPQDLLQAAQTVLPHAYAPYSHFPVAAAVRAKEDGAVFLGCNVENAASPVGMCAEVGAMCALFASGRKKIAEALILVPDHRLCPPCGACRQRLLECTPLDATIHLCTTHGDYHSVTLGALLPLAFGPQNLE